ncbi:MAG TPA: hypothetical protein VMD77_03970 [Candidatus Baltobacteraceae bacterium]|nr:hypothetical protein [Candidatus Baltobacteraceae bacterium]
MDSNQPSTQRRRSERLSQSVPLIVRGIDLLGQPFQERTSTLALNLHGCRYSSKHHLPRNTWVTLEVPQAGEMRNVRARVAWIQRPHSVREFFQIGVELESPANVWGMDPAPESWRDAAPAPGQENTNTWATKETIMSEITNPSNDFESAGSTYAPERVPEPGNPLLLDWKAEIEREASRAAESAAAQAGDRIRTAIEELETFSSGLSTKQDEFLGALRAEFEGSLAQARELLHELDAKASGLRAESEAAAETASRMAQARLQVEAAEAALAAKPDHGVSREETAAGEGADTNWRERLQAEMAAAQAQWNELLQFSLDDSVERLARQLAGRSEEVLRDTEQMISNRFAELSNPLGQLTNEARETLAGLRSTLEEEIKQARSSLSEIEHSASRLKDYSGQLESASHDTLNELHRRLENILEAQTDEMRQRVERLAADAHGRLGPALDALGQQLAEKTIAEVQSKVAPHVERVPELLRELSARELQAEGSLRLFRERLRQVAENNQREASTQLASTLSDLRNDFEAARREALGKWTEELDAGGVRASHAAAESIGRSSEWFQQEARARMQVLAEQTLAAATATFEEKTSEAARQFESKLEEESAWRIAQIQQHLESVTSELSSRARTDIGAAAETAAASFGQVLRGISEQEATQFTINSRGMLAERQQEFEQFTAGAMQNLEATALASVGRFREQMASQVHTSVGEGRNALGAEFAAMIEGFRADREGYKNEWATGLDQLSAEAVAKHQERLQTTSDSWTAASMRRLNEQGQNTIDSLIRAADRSLRDSCSKVFEDLAAMLRQTRSIADAVGFVPPPEYDAAEPSTPHQHSASSGSGL